MAGFGVGAEDSRTQDAAFVSGLKEKSKILEVRQMILDLEPIL